MKMNRNLEGKRQEVITRVIAKTMKQSEAATVLGVSVRQIKRLCRTVRAKGTIGLARKRKGCTALNRTSDSIK